MSRKNMQKLRIIGKILLRPASVCRLLYNIYVEIAQNDALSPKSARLSTARHAYFRKKYAKKNKIFKKIAKFY